MRSVGLGFIGCAAVLVPQLGCGGSCTTRAPEVVIRSAEYQMWLRDGVCDRARPASGVTPSGDACPTAAQASEYTNRCFQSGSPPVEEATFVRYQRTNDECRYAMRITLCTE